MTSQHATAVVVIVVFLVICTTADQTQQQRSPVAPRPNKRQKMSVGIPAPDRALRQANPHVGYHYHRDFVPTKLRTAISDYSDGWARMVLELDKKLMKQGRLNMGAWEPEFAQRMWDGLVGEDPERLDMLRLPSRPGWRPVGFSSYILPCVYLEQGAEFHIHMDYPRHHNETSGESLPPDFESRDPERPVNWAKLVLYPEPFEGGELVFYDRDELVESRTAKLQRARKAGEPRIRAPPPRELARIEIEAGSVVLFDMWYPHASLPLRGECRRKVAMGMRVLYARDGE